MKAKACFVLLAFLLGFALALLPSPMVDAYTSYSTVTLPTGYNYIHGSYFWNGSLWFSTRTIPSHLIKMNASTLSYTTVTFTGYKAADDVEAAGNYIWVVTNILGQGYLLRVNPNSLAWSAVISFGTSFMGAQSLCYSFNFLWIGGESKIAKVNITDFTYTLYSYSATIGTRCLHGLTNSSTYIYASTLNYYGSAFVLKIDPTNPTTCNSFSIADHISDDIDFLGTNLYAPSEDLAQIYKIQEATFPAYTLHSVGSSGSYGLTTYGNNIWVYYKSSPGSVKRLNTTMAVWETIVLPIGYDMANEMIFDDNENGFVTCWMAPAKIVKYHNINSVESYPAQYNIHGPFYENGNVAPYLVNVTYYALGELPIAFSLNGTDGVADIYQFNATITTLGFFVWNITSPATNQTRTIYCIGAAYENIYIFIPNEGDYSYLYTVSFFDLVGVLKEYPYVSAHRLINGTNMLVERRKIDKESKVYMALTYNQRYTITLGSELAEYTFGDVEFGPILTLTLTIRGIDFPKETLLTYKYVRIYGLRTFATPTGIITITFQDTLMATYSVAISITYRNGTEATSYSTSSQSFSYQWTSADNSTDYQVLATISHERYGTYQWKQYFPRTFTENPWESLGFLGDIEIDFQFIIAVLLIVLVGGGFSMVNPYVGAILASCVAAMLTYIGWIPIPPGYLITAICLSIILALVFTKRRMTYG